MTSIINGLVNTRGNHIRPSGSDKATCAIPTPTPRLRDPVAAPLTCSLVVPDGPGAGGRMLHLFLGVDLYKVERLSWSRWDFSLQTQSMVSTPLRGSSRRHRPAEALAVERKPSPDIYLREPCSRLSSSRCRELRAT